jgi:aspartyl-tRNA(Asn)/glutamyl-tRNA(Gln) amidotransferase subunit C
MASQLGNEEVLRIAELARLTLAPEDVPRFAEQLGAILDYAASIQRVDTADAATTAATADAQGRDDVPAPSLERDVVLEQAPGAARESGLFRVPKVL